MHEIHKRWKDLSWIALSLCPCFVVCSATSHSVRWHVCFVCESVNLISISSLQTTTGWDLEWRLVERRLTRVSRKTRRIRSALRCAMCRGSGGVEGDDDDEGKCGCGGGHGSEARIRINNEPVLSRQRSEESKWRKMNRRFWTSLWSLVGPRQIFPALDDLQLLCAFVDVHDEMLMRGDQGLRIMLGNRLL